MEPTPKIDCMILPDGREALITDADAQKSIEYLMSRKQDIEPGKGLSTCDFTAAMKARLESSEYNSQENRIEEVYVDGEPAKTRGKKVMLDSIGGPTGPTGPAGDVGDELKVKDPAEAEDPTGLLVNADLDSSIVSVVMRVLKEKGLL